MRPEWIYSLGFYFEPKARGEVKIFGFYKNKQKNKKTYQLLSLTILLQLWLL